MAEPPLQIKELVDRFDQNFEAYQNPAYNEERTGDANLFCRRQRVCFLYRKKEFLFGSAGSNLEWKTRLQREIEATDRQIDQLVFELYGLTEEEIKIVETDKRGNVKPCLQARLRLT
jgi:hypothetical protein